jgi:hypothetical protein
VLVLRAIARKNHTIILRTCSDIWDRALPVACVGRPGALVLNLGKARAGHVS